MQGLGTVAGFFRYPPQLITHTDREAFQLEAAFPGKTFHLPADGPELVENLRLERYGKQGDGFLRCLLATEAVRGLYYRVRPLFGDRLRRTLQRIYLKHWQELSFPQWPVDTTADWILERSLILAMKGSRIESLPFIWFWPDGARSAAVMTHDVEAVAGVNFVPDLLKLDEEYGIRGSFQLVPEERYPISNALIRLIRQHGCEVNVHGLNHDGNMFRDRALFERQAAKINQYIKSFGSKGFRAACMYRNQNWLGELNIAYDMSVPNVAHLEPQRGGCCTVFPYFIGDLLELPLTTIQDYSLLHILDDRSMNIWNQQIDLILQRHGLMSFIVHPDYLLTNAAQTLYRDLLKRLSRLRTEQQVWMANPGDVHEWWRNRSQMTLLSAGDGWRVEGPGAERARVAFASVDGDRLAYHVPDRIVADSHA